MFNSIFDELFRSFPLTSPFERTYTDDGVKRTYYKNGIVHNETGPAVVYSDGKVEYWLDGKQVDKSTVDKLGEEKELNRKVYITVDDKQYVITGKQLKELNLHGILQSATK